MQRRGLQITLAILALYGIAYILKTSFEVDGIRYFALFDDAMISMRYAKNLALGHGLVWNPGEYVEGFTNPMWTLYMSLWHLLPIAAEYMSLPIQITGLVCMLGISASAYRLANEFTCDHWASILAAVLVGFFMPLLAWTLLGMEVGIVTLGVTWSILRVMAAMRTDAIDRWFYLILGILTLVRFDAVVYLAALSLALAYYQPTLRKQHLTWLLWTLLIFVGGQTIVRLVYYGEIFPNTYYLKATGYPFIYRLTRGGYVLLHSALKTGLVFYLLPVAYFVINGDKRSRLVLILLTVACAYSVYVGGDAWEWNGEPNRYVLPVMPALIVLWIAFMRIVTDRLFASLSGQRKNALLTLAAIWAFLDLNSNRMNAWDPMSLETMLLLQETNHVMEHPNRVREANWIKRHTSTNAKIAMTWAGITPYFSGRTCIDLYGKADKRIANMDGKPFPNARPIFAFTPGHNKWDYAYSIGVLNPDVITQIVPHGESVSELTYYDTVATEFGHVFVRKGSTAVHP